MQRTIKNRTAGGSSAYYRVAKPDCRFFRQRGHDNPVYVEVKRGHVIYATFRCLSSAPLMRITSAAQML
jgi:hypothetical protein